MTPTPHTIDRRTLARQLVESDPWNLLLAPEIAERIAQAETALLSPDTMLDDVTLARAVRRRYSQLTALKSLLDFPGTLAPPQSE